MKAVLHITIDCDNDAFHSPLFSTPYEAVASEVSRILLVTAGKVSTDGLIKDISLTDINGNIVGSLQLKD